MFALFAPPSSSDASAARGYASTLEPPGKVALKRLIWLYFWLLIFEGALRKWVAPGLSNPLLLVRDPVVVLIYISAGMAGVFPRSGFIPFIVALSVLSMIVSEAFGTGNILVSLYGFRTTFLHLPLVFLLPQALDRKDVEKMAKALLIVAIPMFFLTLVQFRASPDAWVNNGAGGGVGAQLTVGYGKIRPPGTFSFTAGLVTYLTVAAAIAICAQMKKDFIHPRLAVASLAAIGGMVLISGSRGALGGMSVIMIAVGIICVQKPKLSQGGIRLIAVGGLAYLLMSSFSEFRTGMEIHQSRIQDGGGIQDGILFRILGGFIEPFTAMMDAPFFGTGLGMGTNGATGFMNAGEVTFKLGEGELGRIIREMGPILGFTYISLRLAIVVFLTRLSFDSLQRDNPLPILILSSCAYDMLSGQFGVPTILGLTVFKGGLCLASTHLDAATSPAPEEDFARQPAPVVPVLPGFRGRSAYAEQLHGEVENPVTQRFGP